MRSSLPALLATLALAVSPGAAADRTRIEDDYARALALARERGVPMVVDVWAPW